jgi:hypothetical protein
VAQHGRHPRGRFGPGPDAPIRGGRLQGGDARGTWCCGEASQATRMAMPPVPQAFWPMRVVALGDAADPVDGVPGHHGHLRRGAPLGEEPDHLPVAARDRILGRTIAALQDIKQKV